MLPKPRHLSPEYAAAFTDPSVVAAYPNRPPYPPEAIEFLASLAVGDPRVVLDAGCGTGDVARPLAPLVDRVDAVDISAGMIERGRRLPGGENPAITWICAPVERAPFQPGYGLITAGESLHWMEWEVVMPRFADVLVPGGVLAIVGRDWEPPSPLWERMLPIIEKYSTSPDYRPCNLTEALTTRGLFDPLGERGTDWVPWTPTVEEYIGMRHSQSAFSRERMGETAEVFDRETRAILHDLVRDGAIEQLDGRLQLSVQAKILWGRPKRRLT